MFGIRGLQVVQGYVTENDEAELMRQIDGSPWDTELSRRRQQYGYEYNHGGRNVRTQTRAAPIPDWLRALTERLVRDKIMNPTPDQVIVNEYVPGQGIAQHLDCVPCFGPIVVGLSLLAPVVMDFRRQGETIEVPLERRSLVILAEDGRYRWSHAIAKRTHDTIGNVVVPRRRRVSVTFRTVKR